MSDNHLVGDEFLSVPLSASGPETQPPQEFGVDEEEEELINTLSPGRRRIRFPQGNLAPKPANSGSDNELLQFRMMLVNAKSQNAKSTLQLDSMAPSKPVTTPLDMNKRSNSPIITNSRLASMSNDNVAWERRQAQLRDLKDLNLILLGIAFGSVLLLAAVVLYMYIQY
ncbi:MAG: hypothetical protein P4L53_03520 [Candidatus Obscuribacterales bacterium]|nr:hypothetical protein [Candidatus Obscuribacterales bacterium]